MITIIFLLLKFKRGTYNSQGGIAGLQPKIVEFPPKENVIPAHERQHVYKTRKLLKSQIKLSGHGNIFKKQKKTHKFSRCVTRKLGDSVTGLNVNEGFSHTNLFHSQQKCQYL